MNCAECKELLVGFLEGLLDESERLKVSEHLRECPSCGAELTKCEKIHERLVLNGKAFSKSDFEENVFNRIVREQKIRLEQAGDAGRTISYGRIIMRSKIIKSAAAAVIILAVVLGIPFFRGTGPAVTLAAVYEKILLVDAFMYKAKMMMTGNIQQGMPAGEQQMEGTVAISTEHGIKMDIDINLSVNGIGQRIKQQMYVLPQEKKIYMIVPEQKQYIEMEFSDEMFEKMKNQYNDPRDMVKKMLNCKYTELGKSTIDGVEVEGFQTTDPVYFGGMSEDVNVVLWVDAKSQLPVRAEINMKMNEQMKMDGIFYDFQWYVPVEASVFVPVIPSDYKTSLPGGYKLPSATEESAIDGLRFSGELLGRYPKKLDMMNLMNEIVAIKDANVPTEAALKLKKRLGLPDKPEQMAKMSQEEQTKMVLDVMKPVQSLGMFYMMLVQDKKEPAYYGDVVKPADADKVLMRWKTGDNEHRVIYGNLTAETVSAEKLAELESQLPK